MGNLKSLALLALLFSLSLDVFADISTDAIHAKDEVKPSTKATDANDVVVEPQQGWGGRGGGWGGGGPGGGWGGGGPGGGWGGGGPGGGWGGGGCRFGCCGGGWYGRCNYCCRSQAEANEVVETAEPQQSMSRGGCRNGCCGGWYAGRCKYCCSRDPDEASKVVETVEPQQRGGCWFGCCGSYANGQCSACCSKKMAVEGEKKKVEAKP